MLRSSVRCGKIDTQIRAFSLYAPLHKRRYHEAHNHKRRGYCKDGIKSVHYAAVTREKIAVILHSVLSLNKGGDKVAELRYYGEGKSYKSEGEIICLNLCQKLDYQAVKKAAYNSGYHSSDSALNGFLRAYLGNKLMLAYKRSDDVRHTVTYPSSYKYEKEAEHSVRHIPYGRKGGE